VLIDLQERELLAQLVLVAVVRFDVDGLDKEERFVEPVELLLDRLGPTLGIGGIVSDLGLALLLCVQHVPFHEPHVAGRWL
jgi:hypothetical protein